MAFSISHLGVLIFSIIPLSLVIIKIGLKFFQTQKISANTQAICTNITGVITKSYYVPNTILFENYQTRVKKDGKIKIKNLKSKENAEFTKSKLSQYESVKLLASIASLCHYPKVNHIENSIIKFLKECKIHNEIILKEYVIIQELESNNQKKFSTVVAQHKENKEIFAFSKGKPEKIIEKCNRIIIDDTKVELTDQHRQKILNKIKRLNKRGQKSIAFAYRPLPNKKLPHYDTKSTEKELVLIGVIGLIHPINENAKEGFRIAKRAGIKIFTLTPIKEKNAEVILKKVSVIKSHLFKNITLDKLKTFKNKKLNSLIKKKNLNLLFSELTKSQEEKLINMVKKNYKNVVVASPKNDLKQIVTEINKARIHTENKKKIILHSIPSKIAQVLILILTITLKTPLAFTLLLIIAIEIFVNTPLEIALKMEKPIRNLMDRSYQATKHPFKNKKTLSYILLNGLLIAAILAIVYIWNLFRHGWTYGQVIHTDSTFFAKAATSSLVLFAVIQIIRAYSLRQINRSIFRTHPISNLFIWLFILISLLIVNALINLPYFQEILNLSTLSTIEWQLILLCASIIIIFDEIRIIFKGKTDSWN